MLSISPKYDAPLSEGMQAMVENSTKALDLDVLLKACVSTFTLLKLQARDADNFLPQVVAVPAQVFDRLSGAIQ